MSEEKKPAVTIRPVSGARLSSIRGDPPRLSSAPLSSGFSSSGISSGFNSGSVTPSEPKPPVSVRDLMAKTTSDAKGKVSEGRILPTMVSNPSGTHQNMPSTAKMESSLDPQSQKNFQTLAFSGQHDDTYRPTSLPLTSESVRESDIEAPVAQDLFDANGKPYERKLFVVQMPPIFPALQPKYEMPATNQESDERKGIRKIVKDDVAKNQAQFGTPIREMPDGEIGKFRVLQNGDVQLVLGNIVYSVMRGTKPCFHEKAAILNQEDKEVLFLGDIQGKLLVEPIGSIPDS
jgi:RNA polymerase III RPC4